MTTPQEEFERWLQNMWSETGVFTTPKDDGQLKQAYLAGFSAGELSGKVSSKAEFIFNYKKDKEGWFIGRLTGGYKVSDTGIFIPQKYIKEIQVPTASAIFAELEGGDIMIGWHTKQYQALKRKYLKAEHQENPKR